MTTAMTTTPAGGAIVSERLTFTQEQVALMKRTVCSGASNDEFAMFLGQCQRTGLDPFAKQIYLVKRQDRMCIQTGIDGFRLIAERSGQYAGNDDPVFDDEDAPRKATVTVYKIINGIRCPFTASARWDQYYPGDRLGFMWKKMPHVMLGKCAESLALRKAFPQELSGLYTAEEMQQADSPRQVTDVRALSLGEVPAPQRGPVEGEIVDAGPAPDAELVEEFDRQLLDCLTKGEFRSVGNAVKIAESEGKLTANGAAYLRSKHADRFRCLPEADAEPKTTPAKKATKKQQTEPAGVNADIPL